MHIRCTSAWAEWENLKSAPKATIQYYVQVVGWQRHRQSYRDDTTHVVGEEYFDVICYAPYST